MDFLSPAAREWKHKHYEDPYDVYHFAIPCTNFSIAKTSPEKVRSLDNPYGDETNEEVVYYNKLARA
eukprot:2174843-Pyramimonas_sp.AAC.1